MGTAEKAEKHQKARSLILIQITSLVIIVFLIFGVVSLLFYRSSQNNLIETSKEKMIENEVELISSASDFTLKLVFELIVSREQGSDLIMTQDKLTQAILNKEVTPPVETGIELVGEIVNMEVYGLDEAFVIIPSMPPVIEKPLIIMASNEDRMFEAFPEDLEPLLKDEVFYKLYEDGIPALGLDGAHLIMVSPLQSDLTSGQKVYLVTTKPMEEQLASLNEFYDKENNKTTLFMGIIIVACIAILVFLTFFVLSYLIRKKITRPIDELESAASKVMEGDLDIEVPVRKGEEFSNLKKAFNGMIYSIREVISKATGDKDQP